MNDRTIAFPTVTNHSYDNGQLILETADPRTETNLVSTEDGLARAGELVTEEQKEQLALYEM